MTQSRDLVAELVRGFGAVGDLLDGVRADQWSAPTPCSEWTVRDVVSHLVLGNKVFTATVRDQAPPDRAADHLGDDPVAAYRDTAAALVATYELPGVLDGTYVGPLGPATGAQRLQIRLMDLLAHGWDLATATAQPMALPEDLAEHSLEFFRPFLAGQDRTGRFGPEQPVAADAPAIERLVAFLGRPVGQHTRS